MRILKSKNGMALITVMIIFLVLTVLLGALVVLTHNNLNQSIKTEEHTTAYYTAEAGMTKAVTEFEDHIAALSQQSPALSVQAFITAVESYVSTNNYQQVVLSENNDITPYADVTLAYNGIVDGTYHSYVITSTGYFGRYDRTLVTTYNFDYSISSDGSGFVIDKAVMVNSTFELSGSSQVIGAPISTYSTSSDAITLGWSTRVPAIELDPSLFDGSGDLIDTDIFNNTSNINNKITEGGLDAVGPLDEVHEFPPIVMPTYPNKATLARLPAYSVLRPWGSYYQLIQDDGSLIQSDWNIGGTVYNIPSTSSWYYVPEFSITAGNTDDYFMINVGDTDKYLVVDKLKLDGHFEIIGNGSLTIYVTGNTPETALTSDRYRITLGFTSSTPVGAVESPEKLVVYVDPIFYKSGNKTYPATLSVGGSAVYNLSLMAANLNITIGGGASFNGYIVTGGETVSIQGGSGVTTTLYYAPNADVYVSGSGYVNGAIIGDTFSGSGNVRVRYDDVAFENFPFMVMDPITGGSGADTPVLLVVRGMTIEQ